MDPSSQEGDEWLGTLRAKASDSDKSWTVALFLSIFLGLFGVDRLYLGYGVLGLLKLLSFGGGGFWWLLDVVLILINKLKDSDGGVLHSPFCWR